jgi:TPP-dependent pyruvate/acetoin dehydrogenase alpha subunit
MVKGTDWVIPCYRENLAMHLHGMPYHQILMHWMGDERGNMIPEGVRMTPLSVPIGTHMLHAAGIGWAMKLRGEEGAVITYFGDGATSEGDFHGAMNFASVLKAPVVFYCQNNQWAISVPFEQQMASQTVAQKALAYGMPTIRVDGNDIFAVYKATREARERAVAGEGPSFIEGLTYRLGDHTTADDARRYREQDELEAWMEKDPLIRTRKYLVNQKKWDDEKQAALGERAEKIVQEIVRAAEGVGEPSPSEFFDHMFAEIPKDLAEQRDTMRTSSLGVDPGQVGLRGGPVRQGRAGGPARARVNLETRRMNRIPVTSKLAMTGVALLLLAGCAPSSQFTSVLRYGNLLSEEQTEAVTDRARAQLLERVRSVGLEPEVITDELLRFRIDAPDYTVEAADGTVTSAEDPRGHARRGAVRSRGGRRGLPLLVPRRWARSPRASRRRSAPAVRAALLALREVFETPIQMRLEDAG